MFTFRDLIIFLAGAEFFHTLIHIFLYYFISLPLDLNFMVLTSRLNNLAIIINAVFTIGLIWWAKQLR